MKCFLSTTNLTESTMASSNTVSTLFRRQQTTGSYRQIGSGRHCYRGRVESGYCLQVRVYPVACHRSRDHLTRSMWFPIGVPLPWPTTILNCFWHIKPQTIKRIGVTALTCQGHVTLSVTWPFNWNCAVSYRWSVDTFFESGTAIF